MFRFGVWVDSEQLEDIRFHVSRQINVSLDIIRTPSPIRRDDGMGGPFRSSHAPSRACRRESCIEQPGEH